MERKKNRERERKIERNSEIESGWAYDSWNNIPHYRNSNGKGPCEALLTSYYAHHS